MTWLRPLPVGRPYHQLARTDLHAWWRLPAGLVVAVVLSVIVMFALVAALVIESYLLTGSWLKFGSGDSLFANDVIDIAMSLVLIAALLPVIWVVTAVVDRRRIGTLSSVAGRIRWRWLLVCLLPAAAYPAGSFAASLIADQFVADPETLGAWIGWSGFLPVMLLVVLLVPFQAAAEEFVFRGWLLQAIGAFTFETRSGWLGRAGARVFATPWPAIIVASVPFVAGHGYTDWGLVAIGLFAVVTGWVTVATGGLEAAIALHIANNLTSFGFDAAEGELSLEQGAVPLPYVVADAIGLLVCTCIILVLAQARGIAVRSNGWLTPATADR